MIDPPDLPAEPQHVADPLNEQPLTVRNLFRYLLVMSMIDEHKAKIVDALTMRGRHYLRIATNVGEVFWILRPAISMASELRMRQQVKAILEEPDD